MRIRIKRGLDIPFGSRPSTLLLSLPKPKKIALNLEPFDDIRFKLHVKVGDRVKVGQPIAENKVIPGQFFVSTASGVIAEVKRGLKRRLLDVVITVDEKEELFVHEPPSELSKEAILSFFMQAGVFPHIRQRPFNLVANPNRLPKAIFVRATESRPFVPAASWQVEGRFQYFDRGLQILHKLAPVHLVHREKTPCVNFKDAQVDFKHSVRGPHPASNPSVHIHNIMPIRSVHDTIWTIDVEGVITIGKLFLKGSYYTDRVISLAGGGVKEPAHFHGRMGYPIGDLVQGRVREELLCIISGDPLTGSRVDVEDFLGFYDSCVSVLPINTKRQMFHFMRLGMGKFTATRTYLSGFFPKRSYDFTTNMHGEERAFIDPALYDKVMPMRIPTVQLVKAVLAQDFELAELLGIYEVAPEDFALPTFICPSKIDMVSIMKQGLHLFAQEMGH